MHISHFPRVSTSLDGIFVSIRELFLPNHPRILRRIFSKRYEEIIHRGRTWSQDRLIANLNPIIRGWALYHKHAVSSDVFSRLDHIVWGMLYSWAKRRHSNKGKHWISHRYWHKIGNKSWTFASDKLILVSFSNTKIERYRMAKLEMNPYIDRGYFEEWQERRRNFFP